MSSRSIGYHREALAEARSQFTKLAKDPEMECLADEQFEIQMQCLIAISQAKTTSLSDILVKLLTWKEESFPTMESLMEASIEQKLVLSVIEDLSRSINLSSKDERRVTARNEAA